jgi:hypothetical protein
MTGNKSPESITLKCNPNGAEETGLFQPEDIKLDDSPTSAEETDAFKNREEKEEERKKRIENDSAEQDKEERKKFSERAFGITQTWIGFLIVLTVAQFTLSETKHFGLSDTTFNIVFTTTTASVFGFWSLVGKYLFNSKKTDD